MLEFQALTLTYHRIAIRVKIVNYKKFYSALKKTGGQRPSESLH